MMSSARAMYHMSHASELRSSRGRTRICSSVTPPKVPPALDILLPPTAAECTAPCWSRNSSRRFIEISPCRFDRSSDGDVAPVHEERGAGDVRGLVGGPEQDARRDLRGGPRPLEHG